MGGDGVETSPLSGSDVFLGHKQKEMGAETKAATRGAEKGGKVLSPSEKGQDVVF